MHGEMLEWMHRAVHKAIFVQSPSWPFMCGKKNTLKNIDAMFPYHYVNRLYCCYINVARMSLLSSSVIINRDNYKDITKGTISI